MQYNYIHVLLEKFKKYLSKEEGLQDNIKNILQYMSNEDYEDAQKIRLRNPTLFLVLSIAFGVIGLDRFMLKRVFSGLLKAVVCLVGLGLTFSLIPIFPPFAEWELWAQIIAIGVPVLFWGVDIFIVQSMVKRFNYDDIICSLHAFKHRTDAKHHLEGRMYGGIR